MVQCYRVISFQTETTHQRRREQWNTIDGRARAVIRKRKQMSFFFLLLALLVLDISAEAKSTGKVIISEATRQYRLSECVCVCRYKQILGPNRIRNNNHPMLQIETTHHHREGCSFFLYSKATKKNEGVD